MDSFFFFCFRGSQDFKHPQFRWERIKCEFLTKMHKTNKLYFRKSKSQNFYQNLALVFSSKIRMPQKNPTTK